MAANFKVLRYNQNLMAILGIYSNETKNEFFKSPVAIFILFILSVFAITSTGIYAYKNIQQFDDALQAIYVSIAGIQCVGMYVTVGRKMREIKTLQFELQKIVDEGVSLETGLISFHSNYFLLFSARK